jgi:Uma2 family endonuclease
MAMPATDEPVTDPLGYAADHIQVPQGYRVEIIEGEIVVSPTPQGRHALDARWLHHEIERVLPDGFIDVENVTVQFSVSRQRYIPDVVVLPRDMLDSSEWLFPAEAALLVVEITSPDNADIDRVKKLRGYASSSVPCYLLIDREDRTVSLFSDPEGRIYRHHLQVPFGEAVTLPAPFTGTLDTAPLL